MARSTTLSVTDLFCGAGGSSLGMHHASDEVEITLALNHWRLAVESHNANFPNTAHDCVDVSSTDPRRYRSTTVLWASPECTNHTLAKGKPRKHQGQPGLFEKAILDPAEERSRATMFDVPRFAEYHDYEVVVVENVVDVRYWRMYDAWLHAMSLLGYDHKEVYFNSMFAHLDPAAVRDNHDFAPQSRDRAYIVFWKRHLRPPDLEFRPRAWCEKCAAPVEAVQSWKNGRKWGRYRQQYVYRCPVCAAEVIPHHFAAWNAVDWSLPAERIGDRARPLQERTMERIRKGLERYGNTWLVLDTAFAAGDRSRPMLAALPTQTGRQTLGMVTPQVLALGGRQNRDNGRAVTEPLPTQTGTETFGVLMPQIVTLRNHGEAEGVTDSPLPTFAAAGNHVGLLVPQPFYLGYANGDGPPHGIEEPLPTMRSGNNAGVVIPMPLMVMNYTPGHTRPVSGPLGSITTSDHHAVLMPFLTSYYGSSGDGRPVDEEMGTLTAADRHALVMPMSFYLGYANGEGPPHGIEEPLPTMRSGNNAGLVFPPMPPAVEDCGFRMLQPHEVGRGMAFPDTYEVLGNKRDRVRQYGNAVTPPVAKMLMRRVMAVLA